MKNLWVLKNSNLIFFIDEKPVYRNYKTTRIIQLKKIDSFNQIILL